MTAVEQHHAGKPPGPRRGVQLGRHLFRRGGRCVGKAYGGRGATGGDEADNREPEHTRHGFEHTSVAGTNSPMKSPGRTVGFSPHSVTWCLPAAVRPPPL